MFHVYKKNVKRVESEGCEGPWATDRLRPLLNPVVSVSHSLADVCLSTGWKCFSREKCCSTCCTWWWALTSFSPSNVVFVLSPTWSLTDVCGSLDILPAAHHKRTTTVLSLRWSGGCLQIGSDRQEDPATPGFVQWRQTLANRTLALHLPGGRQLFVTTGGALWAQQRSSGVCYKRKEEEPTGEGEGQ